MWNWIQDPNYTGFHWSDAWLIFFKVKNFQNFSVGLGKKSREMHLHAESKQSSKTEVRNNEKQCKPDNRNDPDSDIRLDNDSPSNLSNIGRYG
jgi:hypothetical protein